MRMNVWEKYHEAMCPLEVTGVLGRPIISEYAEHNAHIYYVLLNDKQMRDKVLAGLVKSKIHACTHFEPLHSSKMGGVLGY